MRPAAILALPLALAACNPPPRAASDFKAHPVEAGKLIVDCAAGTHRGAECENGEAAQAQILSDARQSLYKKSFR